MIARWKWDQFWGRSLRGKFYNAAEFILRRRLPYVSFTTDPMCPLKCNCCPWKTFNSTSVELGMPHMTMEEFKLYLSHIPKSVLIDFSGFGESMTNPFTPFMVLWAYKHGYRVQVFTTLVGLSRHGAEALAKTKMEKLMIHVPDDRNFIYPTERWLKQLDLLRGLKFPTIIFSGLGEVDPAILKAVKEFGHFVPVHMTDKAPLETREKLNSTGTECAFAGSRLDQWAIWPNGDVSVCFFDYGHGSVIGNLREQTYKEIKDGEPLRIYRDKMELGKDCLCRYCNEAKPL